MVSPFFLSVEDVLRIHQDQISRYGGTLGVRDPRLLESAVALPRSTFDRRYLHEDLYMMAAAYLFHLCQNHPFLDGNKRTAAAAAIAFLYINKIVWVVDEEKLEHLVLSVAEGKTAKLEIVLFLRDHVSTMHT